MPLKQLVGQRQKSVNRNNKQKAAPSAESSSVKIRSSIVDNFSVSLDNGYQASPDNTPTLLEYMNQNNLLLIAI
jgi:predicted transcriptional regulator